MPNDEKMALPSPAIVYSEVRGKTGRKILKIYFSLSVSWVNRALSLLSLYTSPPSSAPGIASSCTTNTISCISHLFSQPLFFSVPCLPHLIFLLLTILASQQGEGRRNSNCTEQHMCLCLGGNREGREEGETLPPLNYTAQLGGNREGREEIDTSPPPLSPYIKSRMAIVKRHWNIATGVVINSFLGVPDFNLHEYAKKIE